MEKVTKRWHNVAYGRAFDGWVERAAKSRRLKSIVIRWLNVKCARAFVRWADLVSEVQVVTDTAYRVVQHLRNRSLSLAFDGWLARTQAAQYCSLISGNFSHS